ncbi:MAG: hypothetical protein DMG35_11335 [Acidobacteria bacterium]|nr:MAG: hypothetical protein AUH86_02275 [Acidobacteria bacterium 13_1_40CM_4_58_4]PYT60350.1 MAG: hypothetical protein DMG35_11335 [Acidobacteriota bacterium]
MRLHDQFRPILVKPAAAIAIANVNKIHRPVVFAAPITILNPVPGGIDKHDAPRTQQRHHPPVTHSDIPIDVVAVTVG